MKEIDTNIRLIIKEIWDNNRKEIMNYYSFLQWQKSKRGLSGNHLCKVFDIVVLDLLEYLKLDTLYLLQTDLIKNYTKQIENYASINIESGLSLCKSVYFLEEYLERLPNNKDGMLKKIMKLQYYTNKWFYTMIIDLIQKMALPFYTKENE